MVTATSPAENYASMSPYEIEWGTNPSSKSEILGPLKIRLLGDIANEILLQAPTSIETLTPACIVKLIQGAYKRTQNTCIMDARRALEGMHQARSDTNEDTSTTAPSTQTPSRFSRWFSKRTPSVNPN